MANEPEQPIERLLRESARKRREEAARGPGFELHPATRRLLQGEVARQYGQPGRAGNPRPWRWLTFSPRLVEACVLVALLAVVASVLVPALKPPGNKQRLAEKESPEAAFDSIKPATAPLGSAAVGRDAAAGPQTATGLLAMADAPALPMEPSSMSLVTNALALDKDALSGTGGVLLAGTRRAPMSSTLAQSNLRLKEAEGNVAPPTPAPSAAPATLEDRSGAMPALSIAPPTVSPPGGATAGASSFALAQNQPAGANSNRQLSFAYKALPGGVGGSGAGAATLAETAKAPAATEAEPTLAGAANSWQRFARVAPFANAKAADQNAAAGPVLAKFQVTQNGRELKVLDSDGSVYTGFLQAASAPARKLATDSLAPAVPQVSSLPAREESTFGAQAQGPVPAVRFFRVTGTNLSLKQRVVFSGSLSSVTNATFSGALQGRTGGAAAASQATPAAAPLPNTHISGQVSIGRGKPTPLEAVPTP